MEPEKKNQEKKPIKGIENIRFLYFIILLAILIGVIVTFEANVVWLRSFVANLRTNFVDYEYSQANHAAGMMEDEANGEIDQVQTLAHDISIMGLDSSQSEVFINDFLKRNNHTREISIINLDGQETNRYSRESTFNPNDLQDFSSLEQFKAARNGKTYFSRVNYTDNAEPFVIITTPVSNLSTGEIKAILQAKYFLRGMWEIALEMKIGNTGRISVFDDKGMLVADPQPSRVLRKTNILNVPPVKQLLLEEESKDINKPQNTIENDNNSGMSGMSGMNMGSSSSLSGTGNSSSAEHTFANRAVSAEIGQHYLNEKNINVVGVAVPLDIAGMHWGVLVEQNSTELEAPLQQVSQWLILFLIGNLVVTCILLWFIYILRKANNKLISSQFVLEISKERSEEEKTKTISIISNFVDPVIVVDSNWRLMMINPAAKRIFGVSDADLGKRIDSHNNRFSFNDFKNIIPIKYEVKELEKDDKGFPVEEEVIVGNRSEEKKLPDSALTGSFRNELIYKVMSLIVCDKNKVCYGHMKIFYDLTREKMVDRMKSDFISIVAHQLRTPLSAVKWAIGMVMDGDAGKINIEQENFLRKGYESNQRMIGLVNDMLNVSRIEEGRFGFTFNKMSFQEVLNDVVSSVEGLVAKKHLKILLEKRNQLPEIYLDKEKMELAFQNILDNAIKYTSDYGEIKISLNVTPTNLEVSVKDTGIGIPDIDKTRIFSKFFRSTNVVKMETEGSGLGLFIVKNIIEKHGGKINISSIEGQGTEVFFTLPLTKPVN